jgi:hypothetical protein
MTFLYPLFEKGVSLFMENPLGQITWFFAMFIIFYAFTIKDDTKLIKVLTFSHVFWILHFFLLGNIWALIATCVAMIRLFLSMRYKRNIYALWFVAFLSIFLGYFSYEWYLSLFPIIATIFASYAFFYLEKTALRIFLLSVSSMWLYYHINTGSISWVINEIVVLITLTITIYRFIYEKERFSYNTDTGKISWRKRILLQLKKKPKLRRRLDYGRFAIFRDRRRFEVSE